MLTSHLYCDLFKMVDSGTCGSEDTTGFLYSPYATTMIYSAVIAIAVTLKLQDITLKHYVNEPL